MLSTSSYSEIINLLNDQRVKDAFLYYKQKYENIFYLKYQKEAVFAFVKNKNGVFVGQAFFMEQKNINAIFLSLKKKFKARIIPYILNSNRKVLFEQLDNSQLFLKMHQFSLCQALKKKAYNHPIETAQASDSLVAFYQKCFANEFDENAEIWLRDFYQMTPNVEKASRLIKINNTTAASIMYWVYPKYIFIFLLGTHPKYRKQNLAYTLIQSTQEAFPNKKIVLTTWAGGNTEAFYLNIGFEKEQLAHVCL